MKKNLLNQVVKETLDDFKSRQEERRNFENQWKLNMNFFMGNQYCSLGRLGLEDDGKQFFWQQREVFNHIAPIVEERLSKLTRIKPVINVLPATNDTIDVKSAQVSKKIINSLVGKINLYELVNEATKWSEICGTSFYKIVWNSDIGQSIAMDEDNKRLKSGDVDISVCSPFEIYPDSNTRENISDCESIIHAKAMAVDEVERRYGIKAKGEDVNIFSFEQSTFNYGGLGYSYSASKIAEGIKKDSVIILEKYVRPNVDYPNGRLIVVAGEELIYDGELPYKNGNEGEREFPFVMQKCLSQPACFWGVSVVERIIPVQRAYNAVKNRKHEFMNRLSLGVLNVEDGSVDLDNLEEDGLCPGKVLVYRQGSKAPEFLSEEKLSGDFADEEEKLINEFTRISGVADITEERGGFSSLSGSALQLMLEQYQRKLACAIDSIKFAIKKVAKHSLRLYKQFAIVPRLARISGDNKDVDIFYFSANDISSDDVRFEAEDDIGEGLKERREMIFTLLDKGLLNGDDGKVDAHTKTKILEMLGYGFWENAQDQNELHIKKANRENLNMLKNDSCEVKEIDDHELHINEHICFMLGKEYEEKVKNSQKIEEIFLNHIEKHKIMKNQQIL